MKVLIAGGGIGGLSLGLSLHAAGIDDVEVFEAAPAIEELGVGINVLPHAVRELTELVLPLMSSTNIATRPLIGPPMYRDIAVITPADTALTPPARRFVERLHASFS